MYSAESTRCGLPSSLISKSSAARPWMIEPSLSVGYASTRTKCESARKTGSWRSGSTWPSCALTTTPAATQVATGIRRTNAFARIRGCLVGQDQLRACQTISEASWLPMHPGGRRCSSLTYAGYARFSRLAGRAPRHPGCLTYCLTGPYDGLTARGESRPLRMQADFHHRLLCPVGIDDGAQVPSNPGGHRSLAVNRPFQQRAVQ